jgi:hypothetical protein
VPEVPTALTLLGTRLCIGLGSRFRIINVADPKSLHGIGGYSGRAAGSCVSLC